MKKLLLTAAAVVLFTTVNAQTKFGVKAGYSLSKLNSDEDLDTFDGVDGSLKSKSGFYIGALVEHKFTNTFALQGEVQYANLGGRAEVGISGITVVENFNLNRIVIPVAAKYYVTPELGIYAGPFVSFKTNTKVNVKVKGAQSDPQALNAAENFLENAFDDSLKSSEFGLFFGAEYNAYKGIFFDARYSFGLSNMIKDPVYDEKMKMNFLQIGVGYKFK
ncbi:opacity protein-like surface antigen [Chryseobacterium sp. H1D6B]|uniref:porin family protein n=1 Tax=Chryseobacterium sp. H1D6B TaxID=2940588 RepID=UPI0015C8BBF0|nr:porin family protein [Chryseobacterium sp. H1D6B]MDH6253977.1 opacity protein-like surface antigen [Chryseobacterium sp. H1D6B]